jgi:dihydrofolate reductase
MRVLLVAAMTVDGKIARGSHDVIDWSSPEDKRMFMGLSLEAGVLIMGRRTYETLERPLVGRRHIVLTRTPSRPAPTLVEFTSAPPAQILADLERRGYETAIIAGGADIYRLFVDARLVDELWLTIEPLAFGSGISLLGSAPLNLRLRLLGSDLLSESSLQLRYQIV